MGKGDCIKKMSYNRSIYNNVGDIGTSSNILKGKNPPFSIEEFYAFYPQFQGLDELPDQIVWMYICFANEVINIERWGAQWKLGMCLFVAHFCSVYLMSYTDTNSAAAAVIAAAQSKGLISSKSVGDVSVSYDFSLAMQDVDRWGQFNLTIFGNQFVHLAKMMSKGPMFVW